MRRLSKFRRSKDAATAVEAALVISAFMFLVLESSNSPRFLDLEHDDARHRGGRRYAMIYNPNKLP